MDNLSELVLKAQRGDKAAFGKLYNEYYKKIYRYCRINIYRSDLAQDICQETFIRTWKALPKFTFDNGGTFQAYIFRIARNLIIDLSRKKKELALEEYLNIETGENEEERIDKEADIEKLKIELSKMDEKDRQILILRYFEDMSYSEISKITGIKEGALRVRAMRILNKVKEKLTDHE